MWVQAGRIADMKDGTVRSADVFGTRVALARVGDEVFATKDACPHSGGPLSEGDLDQHDLTCPFHGWSFDVRTGACTSGPDAKVGTFPTRIQDGRVMVQV
jgi:nitrite reductase (NADH) small subunit